MTEKDIEVALEGIFSGASKVRAHKYASKFSNKIHRQLTIRIASQMWSEDNRNLNSAESAY